ncbi:hypothetical protein V1503_23925 [Bacillus sp. SCS-151]|uniref:hypothetical protein n=1 Tax=Nanhaiella sioensis TaxID=3115293 RepID=UPI0039787945
MLTFIFKKDKALADHYFKIYDTNGLKIKLTFCIITLILIFSVFNPVTSDYLISIKNQYKLISIDNLFDYTIPLLSSFIIFIVFYNDYKDSAYKYLMFLNKNKFNYVMLKRYLIYTIVFCIGTFISGVFYYRNISFLDTTNLLLSLRFIPNILFLSSFLLCMTSLTKNNYFGLLITLTYFSGDLLSGGRLFYIFSIGAHSNNYYYIISPEYYFLNRIILILLTVTFIYLSCKNRIIK